MPQPSHALPDFGRAARESHVGAVLRKLRVTSRHEVTHWAAAPGLIDKDEEDEDRT